MPRGGRRAGAGAPIGNFNGIRNGNHSPRMRRVYKRLRAAERSRPDLERTAYALRDAGFCATRNGRIVFNGDIRGVVEFLHHFWFDRPAPHAIKHDHPDDEIAPSPPAGATDPDSPRALAPAAALHVAQTQKTQ